MKLDEILLTIFINSKLDLINKRKIPKKKILSFLGKTKIRSNLNVEEIKQIEEITNNIIKKRKETSNKDFLEYIKDLKKEYNKYMKSSFSQDFVNELTNQRKIDIKKGY